MHEGGSVPYHAIVDRASVIPPLDPVWLIVFTTVFAVSALLTLRRPVFGAAILVAIPPFAFQHAFLGTSIDTSKCALLGVVAGLLGARGVRAALARPPVRTILTAFIAIVLAIALSTLPALYRTEVAREVLKWLQYGAYFGAAAAAYALDPQARFVRTALFASVFVTVASACADLVTGAHSGMWLGNFAVPRIAGLLEGPNQFGGYLEAVIAAVAAWHLARPGRVSGALLACTGFALALTFSRAATACCALAVAIIALTNRKQSARLLPLLAGFLLGACNDALWSLGKGVPARSMLERTSDLKATGGIGSRGELWRAALFFFRTHPVFGIGAGNFEFELPRAGVYGVRTHANSWYLQSLAEGGIVLFGATLAWIVVVLRALARNVTATPWRLAAFAASIALVTHQLADYLVLYPKVAETWIALIGLGVAPARSDE